MKIWESRWQEDRIGFHLKKVNPYLMRFSNQLLLKNPDRVFVIYETVGHTTYKVQFVEYVSGVISFSFSQFENE